MKRLFLILPFLLSMCGKLPDGPVLPSLDILQSGKWGPEGGSFGWYLSFSEKGFWENSDGEGCGGYEGTYSILNGKVNLKPEPSPECPGPDFGPKTCTMIRTSKSLFSTLYLECGPNNLYWNTEAKVEKGELRTINGINVISLGLVSGVANENVMYRQAPDINSKAFGCTYTNPKFITDHISYNFIPEGTQLTLIARTTQKQKIKSWENYWYYVQPASDWYAGGCSPTEGWVFAEFVTHE